MNFEASHSEDIELYCGDVVVRDAICLVRTVIFRNNEARLEITARTILD